MATLGLSYEARGALNLEPSEHGTTQPASGIRKQSDTKPIDFHINSQVFTHRNWRFHYGLTRPLLGHLASRARPKRCGPLSTVCCVV